ncbi:Probable membrane-associated kinase regulator 1, partial [Linum perenne]
ISIYESAKQPDPAISFLVPSPHKLKQTNQLGMGKRRQKLDSRSSQTLPPSPSHSSSSSDFEFTISLSPRKSSAAICPADELFYKGQLLPLHLSPRISMVRTLLLASSSTSSSSDTTTTASRDSTGSSSSSSSSAASSDLLLLSTTGCDSSRPSSVIDDDCKRFTSGKKTAGKYFSLSRFSSVFKKDHSNLISKGNDNNNNNSRDVNADNLQGSSVRRMSVTAKEVIRKYLKKVKPLYEKLSQKQQQKMGFPNGMPPGSGVDKDGMQNEVVLGKDSISSTAVPVRGFSHSFSGNLRYPRKRSCATSCPSSMRSSPSHSGVLSRSGGSSTQQQSGIARPGGGCGYGDVSSMEELQSAIQGAIAHCKNSMMQQGKGILISNEI